MVGRRKAITYARLRGALYAPKTDWGKQEHAKLLGGTRANQGNGALRATQDKARGRK
jgi:hypothetical protein